MAVIYNYHYWTTLVYWSLCFLYIFVFHNKKFYKIVQVIFKILPLLVLCMLCVSMYINTVAPFDVRGPFYVFKLRSYTFSLALSIIGDMYLVFPSMFNFGLAAFLGTQMLLLNSFAYDLTIQHIQTPELMVFTIIAAVSISIYVYVTREQGLGMKIALLLYMIFLSLMVWAASLQAMKFYSPITMIGFVGALSFYCSDVTLALNKWKFRIPKSDIVIMSTYYLAQYLIAFSMMLNTF